jgi:hypothetical protein
MKLHRILAMPVLPAVALMASFLALASSCSKPLVDSGSSLGTPQELRGALSSEGGAVNLAWSAVSGASSYTVYRSVPDGSQKEIGTASTPAYTDSGAVAGFSYSYSVSAAKEGEEGGKSLPAIVFIPFHGEYQASSWTLSKDNSALGPYSFSFSGSEGFSRYYQKTKDREGICSYSVPKRAVLFDSFDADYRTEYYFTYAPVYVWENGDISLDLYTFKPTDGEAFPIGSFQKTIHYKSIQGSDSLGGKGTGLVSEEDWAISLEFQKNGEFYNNRFDGSSRDYYDEPSIFSWGKWSLDAKTGSLTLSNYDASQWRTAEFKTLSLGGTTYYYFPHAVFARK